MSVQIRVRNFAMLAEAELELDRLMVLMGPNNAGKSTLATIAYAICHSRPMPISGRLYLAAGVPQYGRIVYTFPPPEFDKRLNRKASQDLAKLFGHFEDTDDEVADVSSTLLNVLRRPMKSFLEQYAHALVSELERCFGDSLKELATQPNDSNGPLSISLESNEFRISISLVRGRTSVNVVVHELSHETFHTALYTMTRIRSRRDTRTSARPNLNEFLAHVVAAMFIDMPNAAYYLPAARSGMLHSHRAMASGLIRQSSLVGIEDFAVPKLPGVVTDFIGQLLELEMRKEGPFHSTADYLERDILHGAVELIPRAPGSPEIRFAASSSSHALHRTSSMVSELAPVILFIRHVLSQSDLLVIEEPESHLHPGSQVKFARALALLIEQGANILITTHSDYFLTQINNLVRQHTLEVATESSPPSASIDPSLIGAYLFKPNNTGSTALRLTVDPEEGIPDTDFADVTDWLYNESAALRRDINAATPE